MSISPKFDHMIINIKRLMKHTLYMRLVVLLFCITFAVVLMQAGSLFLLDYIPSSHSAIKIILQQEILLEHQLDVAEGNKSAAYRKGRLQLEKHDLDAINSELSWLQSQDDEQLLQAFRRLKDAQADFERSRTGHDSVDDQLMTTNRLIDAYDNLAHALQRDMEIKQSVISLLQLTSLFLIMGCLGAIAFGARRLLVDRIDALTSFVPVEFLSDRTRMEVDEFAELERVVYEMSARLEGFKAETEWFNQTSSERLRRMIRSQDFLYRFVESVNNTMLSETALRKGLFLLEKALNVNNVALIFTENDSDVSTERILFSHHKPANLKEGLYDELVTASLVRFFSSNVDGLKTQCLAVGFTSPSGALGVLKIEADEERLFDETETQLVEVTAQLLSMIMGFQGREQEGRRVALLEERAAIARELHDSLAQSLSFMKIQISRLQSQSASHMSSDALQEIVNDLRGGLNNAYRELRELLATFRVHMDVRGLNFAIQAAINEFMQRSNLSITLDNRLVNCRLTVNEEFHILHVIREALSNIVRHSGAVTVNVALVFQPSGSMMVTIDDDGIGYTAKPEEPDHYGQKIMKERAYSLGGDIAVLRRRKGGTRVRLVFTPKLPQ
ncbi:two-component system, NarL family, nitrate/nitrite sensor histidine kinase NarX [Methylophilaceae bacterium]|nr:two-component system, NarL family, nitrate/nitrite sensor histidine kinase NarX [Methylophilaceae bacterium]